MKIQHMRVEGFGVWSGLELEDLSDRLTVFYGPNEAGKTTLMHFVRSILYGFSPDRSGRYLPPVHGGHGGGSVSIDHPLGSYSVRRIAPDGNLNSPARLTISDGNRSRQGESFLSNLLGGIDESIYNNVFAVGLTEIQQLATLNATDAAREIYNLTTGLDRVSLVSVMNELRERRERLLATGPDASSTIAELYNRKHRLQQEVNELAQQGRRWVSLQHKRGEIDEELQRIQQHHSSSESSARTLEAAVKCRDLWHRRKEVAARLDSFGTLADLPTSVLDELDEIQQRISNRERKAERTAEKIKAVRRQGKSLNINRQLWNHVSRIEALGEHIPWIESLEAQIQRQRNEIEQLDREGASYARGAAGSDGISGETLSRLSHQTLDQLRQPARRLKQCKRRLDQARKRTTTAKDGASEATQKLTQALRKKGKSNLQEALKDAGDRVAQLRRVKNEQNHLEEMEQQRKELLRKSQSLVIGQALPLPVLIGLIAGGMVSFALVLAGFGVFGSVGSVAGWLLILFGLAGIGGVFVGKVLLERLAEQRLASCHQQISTLENQIEQAHEELADPSISSDANHLEQQLRQAQTELREWEQLLPLEHAHKDAQYEAEAAQEKSELAVEELEEAEENWDRLLQMHGLPSGLSPNLLPDLVKSSETVADIQRRRRNAEEDLALRERELQSISTRIGKLYEDVQMQPTSSDPRERLEWLLSTIADQRRTADRQKTLKREFRSLKRQRSRVQNGIEQLNQKRQGMLRSAGVDSQQQLDELITKQDQVTEIRRELRSLDEQIDRLAGNVPRADVQRLLDENDASQLDHQWGQIATRVQEQRDQQQQLHRQLGSSEQEMKLLEQDDRIAEKKAELATVEWKLTEAARQWKVLAATQWLLNSVRDLYEQQRQPETLEHASTFLDALTEGQYIRVWTPLGEDTLRVDDANGESLPLDVLSRGTRESVYLSLRFSLVANYARRGTTLPVVLDDVLVNLDSTRAKAAAKVLRDFAKQGHQVLLFTCHEHIMKMFKSLKVEIRTLPSHLELVQSRETEPQLESEVEEWTEEAETDPEAYDEDEALWEEAADEEWEEVEAEEEEAEAEYDDGEVEAEDEYEEAAEYEYDEQEEDDEEAGDEYADEEVEVEELEEEEVADVTDEDEEDDDEEEEELVAWDEEQDEDMGQSQAVVAAPEEVVQTSADKDSDESLGASLTWETPERWWRKEEDADQGKADKEDAA